MKSVTAMALLVRDYDQAKDWYCNSLGFVELCDVAGPDGHRFVRIGAGRDATFSLVLTMATNGDAAYVGRQAGGSVVLFLHTDDFDRDYERMKENGVTFVEQPRVESYGKVAVFVDLYGNRWDLLQPFNKA